MKNQFRITPYTNESGSQSWRCHGTLNGERKRANFKTEAEAVVQMQNWQCEAMNLPQRALVASTLTQAQTDEAQAAFYRLRDEAFTLTEAIEFAARNFVPVNKRLTVAEAYPLFVADKQRGKQGGLSEFTLEKYKARMKRLLVAFGGKQLSEVLPAHLKPIIDREGSGAINRYSDYSMFNTFFNWALFHEYTTSNPMKKIKNVVCDFGEPVVLPLADCRALMAAAHSQFDGAMAPFLALALFCGMRPREIARLEKFGSWDNIDLEAKTITLGVKIVKGGRARRIVEIPEAALAFLLPHAVKRSPLVAKNHKAKLRSARAGMSDKNWKKDILRHTAISFHLAQHNNENTTAAWAGNSPTIIHKHYRGTVKAADVPQFWAIRPGDGEIIPLPSKAA